MAVEITQEQIKEQKSFIMKLREENGNFAAKNGRARLALTETYGCQQNENDTERIRGMLKKPDLILRRTPKRRTSLYTIPVP